LFEVIIRFFLVDQKAAMYALAIKGARSPHCFIFSYTITRQVWSNLPALPFISSETTGQFAVEFAAKVINPEVNVLLEGAYVAPALFHAFSHIQVYAVEAFLKVVGLEDREALFFDALDIEHFETRFHGRVFSSEQHGITLFILYVS
jgi:hypothetical protein